MIAIAKELPVRARRDEVYVLRRILVRQLQRRTRGIPHAERRECQRRFIQEWERLRDEGGWTLLRAALQGKERRAEGLLGELATAARASEVVMLPEPRLGRETAPGLDWGGSRRRAIPAACREADLFSTPVARSA
jgi:hypothetical protein